jgi:hypothetical protein
MFSIIGYIHKSPFCDKRLVQDMIGAFPCVVWNPVWLLFCDVTRLTGPIFLPVSLRESTSTGGMGSTAESSLPKRLFTLL